MNAPDLPSHPTFPPGLWRRIRLHPGPGWIGGALEDDMHRFHIRIDHDGARITGVKAEAVRHPWTACPGAAPFIAEQLTGLPLAEVAQRDPRQHCTHLFDLAILCATHVEDREPTTLDMQVADRVDGRTTATLSQNGVERLRWKLDGTIIEAPDRLAGLDIKRVSQWKHDLPAPHAEWATLLRRAIFISGARVYDPPMDKRAIEMGPTRMGVCYNYQLPQASHSQPIFERRDFSTPPSEPLEHFEAERAFARIGQ